MTASARGGSGWRCGRHDEYLMIKEADEGCNRELHPPRSTALSMRFRKTVRKWGLLKGGSILLSLLGRRSRLQLRSEADAPIAKGG